MEAWLARRTGHIQVVGGIAVAIIFVAVIILIIMTVRSIARPYQNDPVLGTAIGIFTVVVSLVVWRFLAAPIVFGLIRRGRTKIAVTRSE